MPGALFSVLQPLRSVNRSSAGLPPSSLLSSRFLLSSFSFFLPFPLSSPCLSFPVFPFWLFSYFVYVTCTEAWILCAVFIGALMCLDRPHPVTPLVPPLHLPFEKGFVSQSFLIASSFRIQARALLERLLVCMSVVRTDTPPVQRPINSHVSQHVGF